jgi:hypothetical protein
LPSLARRQLDHDRVRQANKQRDRRVEDGYARHAIKGPHAGKRWVSENLQ